MWFYFSKLWIWGVLAAALAGVIAWAMCRGVRGPRTPQVDQRHVRELADARSAVSRHESRINELLSIRARELDELIAARAQLGTVDDLRARVHELEAELDRIPALEAHAEALADEADRVAPLEEELAGLHARVAELEVEAGKVPALERRLRELTEAADELQQLTVRVEELTAALAAAQAAGAAAVTAKADPAAAAPAVVEQATLAVEPGSSVIDVRAAAAILGGRVALDDRKVVEGIGPRIAELLRADGIRTWRDLAAASPARLKAVLEAAGPRFQMHDPTTWPRQAELLADARWSEFKELTNRLSRGKQP